MPPRRATDEDENPHDIATFLAQQLQNLLPEIVNQVTASVNANANNGNGNGSNGGNGGNGNNGCTYKSFMSCNPKEYVGKGGVVVLTRWIERMETNTQVQPRGREAANAMSWNDFKALLVEEFCLSNEMERLDTFQVIVRTISGCAIDGSEANGIIRNPKQEVWNDCRSCKVRVGLNSNLLWEASVLLGRKKGGIVWKVQ
ncbi:hypothetical protein Tco_0895533 [Tanacetum coccineum]|uniref:Reverse transcriptase domain-containing protein n=1 Tax=Tanacetum coccineum TaxID=301880 RepID=A0ABQ5CEV8_9ASTR